jgi:hypothetical protein
MAGAAAGRLREEATTGTEITAPAKSKKNLDASPLMSYAWGEHHYTLVATLAPGLRRTEYPPCSQPFLEPARSLTVARSIWDRRSADAVFAVSV